MRTLQVGDKPTRLAEAIAEIGRIDKTIHMLNFIHDESCHRSSLLQLNFTEGRHSLARSVFHGKRGELHQRYREGQEDQLGALLLNVLVHWNTIYMDAALDQLKNDNFPVNEEAFQEALQRDPKQSRDWVTLVDGHPHQIKQIKKVMKKLKIKAVLLQDFIHVLEYLWKATWCFHAKGSAAAAAWVAECALKIFQGKAVFGESELIK